jgi:hypothetical protein
MNCQLPAALPRGKEVLYPEGVKYLDIFVELMICTIGFTTPAFTLVSGLYITFTRESMPFYFHNINY